MPVSTTTLESERLSVIPYSGSPTVSASGVSNAARDQDSGAPEPSVVTEPPIRVGLACVRVCTPSEKLELLTDPEISVVLPAVRRVGNEKVSPVRQSNIPENSATGIAW